MHHTLESLHKTLCVFMACPHIYTYTYVTYTHMGNTLHLYAQPVWVSYLYAYSPFSARPDARGGICTRTSNCCTETETISKRTAESLVPFRAKKLAPGKERFMSSLMLTVSGGFDTEIIKVHDTQALQSPSVNTYSTRGMGLYVTYACTPSRQVKVMGTRPCETKGGASTVSTTDALLMVRADDEVAGTSCGPKSAVHDDVTSPYTCSGMYASRSQSAQDHMFYICGAL
jgi:hypothetical protein